MADKKDKKNVYEFDDSEESSEHVEGDHPRLDPRMVEHMLNMFKSAEAVIINTKDMVKLSTRIVDEDDEEQSMPEMVQNINEYIKEEMDDSKSALASMVQPFLFSSIANWAIDTFEGETALFILSNPLAKEIAVTAVMHGFLMGNMLRESNLQIESTREDITQDELDLIKARGEVQDLATKAAMTGELSEVLDRAVQSMKESGAFDKKDDDDDDEEKDE